MAMANKIVEFVQESKSELKKVVWPSRRSALTNTVWVVGVSIAFAVFFGAIDFAMNQVFERVIAR